MAQGNTVPGPLADPTMPKADKRGSRAKRWCFTLNNYQDADLERIRKNLKPDVVGFCKIGKEVGDSGTPHLQGFIHFRCQIRLPQVKKYLGDKVHLEVARGTDEQNSAYVSKDGDIFLEFGTPSKGTTEAGGGTCSYERIVAAADKLSTAGGLSALSDDKEFIETYSSRQRVIEELASAKSRARQIAVVRESLGDPVAKNWQRALLEDLSGAPDNRKVIWITDPDGNSGKTYLSKWLIANKDAIRFENGKSADIKYAYRGERVVVFDLTRSQQEHFNYEVMESIKNGMYFNTKYESGMRVYESPHVVVFANWGPDRARLSADRWDERCLDEWDKEWSQMLMSMCEKKKVKEEVIEIEDDDEYSVIVMSNDERERETLDIDILERAWEEAERLDPHGFGYE